VLEAVERQARALFPPVFLSREGQTVDLLFHA